MELAPNPEDAKLKLPPVDTAPNPGFPPPINPSADIGEKVAVKKALEIAVKSFKAANAKVIKSSLMSYKEAGQQLSEPIEEDHPLFNTPVRVIEISGTFKRRSHRPSQLILSSKLTVNSPSEKGWKLTFPRGSWMVSQIFSAK